ncbi:hypothetical protein ABB37_03662 [Leptomonas pyrrhocoris]|uniref:Uncharacterized protein n=1 Tax=Leptomonas pyrrhocoris TaxID=157538 RepID=A0A0N0VFI2_LEPPY|nr:hypothetical protein ABB37_03662 [Leptomonas pyrrhocoris]KPA81244.1 hypothetical protein ABB37_03662 [Leptomonas pyrrhocoris]|eukprot:XP_015659683.1 hypothetical protein ABB37_03662 [Leptomonas pyrrhocoris]
MRPSLIQCFPHPFTRQWPNTGNPVTCECRQLYALVSVCCCVPNTHLLVLHESMRVTGNMITSMPKGPKYVDYRVTSRTTAEDFCGFLMRAEAAAASGSAHGAGAPEEPVAFSRGPDEVYSPMSFNSLQNNDGFESKAASSSNAPRHPEAVVSPVARSRSASGQRQVVVVCLHGIAEASAPVQSALMDVLCFEQVRSHRRAMRVPTLRVVAFCSCRNFALLLPEPLRAAFTLSTYVSTLSIESAVVLQTNTVASSNIVNKRYMLEVMTSPDGQSLLETVTLSASVLRYLRHLLLVVRGSFSATLSPGALALRRLSRWATVLRAMAVLFMPDETFLRSRALHIRPAHLQNYTTRASTIATAERVSHPTSHRIAGSAAHRPTSPEARNGGTSNGGAGGGNGVAAPQQEQQQHNAGSPYTASATRRAIGGAVVDESEDTEDSSGPSPIESFSNVVVSPSDVACALSCLLGHLMTIPREMVPSEEIITATNAMLGPTGGSSTVVDAYANMLDTQRRGKGGFSFQDPTMWDAVAASWSLRHLHSITDPVQELADTIGGSFISTGLAQSYMANNLNGTLQSTANGTFNALFAGTVKGTFNETMLAERGGDFRNLHASYSSSPGQETLAPGSASVSREAPSRTLNNRPLTSLADLWKSGVADTFDLLDAASTPMLDYWEVREVMRATLICRSAPAPG